MVSSGADDPVPKYIFFIVEIFVGGLLLEMLGLT